VYDTTGNSLTELYLSYTADRLIC